MTSHIASLDTGFCAALPGLQELLSPDQRMQLARTALAYVQTLPLYELEPLIPEQLAEHAHGLREVIETHRPWHVQHDEVAGYSLEPVPPDEWPNEESLRFGKGAVWAFILSIPVWIGLGWLIRGVWG